MRKELAKTYDPKSFEDRIYQFWMDGGYFTAERDPEKTPYTIVSAAHINDSCIWVTRLTKPCRIF